MATAEKTAGRPGPAQVLYKYRPLARPWCDTFSTMHGIHFVRAVVAVLAAAATLPGGAAVPSNPLMVSHHTEHSPGTLRLSTILNRRGNHAHLLARPGKVAFGVQAGR